MTNLAVGSSTTKSLMTTQDASSPDGLPPELWSEHIFLFADRSESLKNGLVCHAWRDMTIHVWRKSNRHDLEQLIDILKGLIPFNAFATELTSFCTSFCASHDSSLTTPEEIDKSFWGAVGKIVGILKGPNRKHRTLAKRAIGDRIPDSIKDIFEITKLNLIEAINTKDFRILSIIFHSLHSRSKAERKIAVAADPRFRHIWISSRSFELGSNPVFSDSFLVKIIKCAFKKNRPMVCQLLSAARPITDISVKMKLRKVIQKTFEQNKIEFFRALIAVMPFLDDYGNIELISILGQALESDKDVFANALIVRGIILGPYDLTKILEKCIEKGHGEFAGALIARGPKLKRDDLTKILKMAIENDIDAVVQALGDQSLALESHQRAKLLKKAIKKNRYECIRLLTNGGAELGIVELGDLIKIAKEKNRSEIVQLLEQTTPSPTIFESIAILIIVASIASIIAFAILIIAFKAYSIVNRHIFQPLLNRAQIIPTSSSITS